MSAQSFKDVVPPPKPLDKVVVVMPAYNAEQTIEVTHGDIDLEVVDEVILVDDCSTDRTSEVSRGLGITTIRHTDNTGYGGNQKTCYSEALARGADIVVMVHPDYQYDARKLIPAIVSFLRLIGNGLLRLRTSVRASCTCAVRPAAAECRWWKLCQPTAD